MKHLILSSLLLLSLSLCSAQNSALLTGTPIGSTSVNYDNGMPSTTEHIPAHAFDGDYSTYYASFDRSNSFVGMDLSNPHIITSVAVAPRQGWSVRVQMAIIEGANKADFSDAIALAIIPNALPENQMSLITINTTKAFRYIRYVSPNNVRCNVAELAFYGYQSAGSNNLLPQLTNLPTLNIHTVNNAIISSKENYVAAHMILISNNGTTLQTDSISIRGRGNASWNFPKKPYKIKLSTKQALLDMPARAKDWTLINTYGDKTIMRNLVAFHFSEAMQMPYTPQCRLVDVVLNGEYQGTYQLCDQKEVGSNRVDIEKMSPTDIELPQLSGGYFVEWDAYAYDEDLYFTTNQTAIPVTVKHPKAGDIVPQQLNYLKTMTNRLESTAYGSAYTSATTGHRTLLDSETFLKYMLIGELSGNTDTYWSTNLYKYRNDDKFYVGPVWDVDLGFDNDNRTYPINQLNDFVYKTKGSTANGVIPLVNRIMSDPSMIQERKDIWAEARRSGRLTPERTLAIIDSITDVINQSQQLNFTRWDILNQYVHQNPRALGSFAAEVNALRTFVQARFVWMDKHLDYSPTSTGVETVKQPQWFAANGTLFFNDLIPGTTITCFDMQGRIIFKQLTQNSSFNYALPTGIYLMQLIVPSQLPITTKIVIQ